MQEKLGPFPMDHLETLACQLVKAGKPEAMLDARNLEVLCNGTDCDPGRLPKGKPYGRLAQMPTL